MKAARYGSLLRTLQLEIDFDVDAKGVGKTVRMRLQGPKCCSRRRTFIPVPLEHSMRILQTLDPINPRLVEKDLGPCISILNPCKLLITCNNTKAPESLKSAKRIACYPCLPIACRIPQGWCTVCGLPWCYKGLNGEFLAAGSIYFKSLHGVKAECHFLPVLTRTAKV
jgi:hypothetical protein